MKFNVVGTSGSGKSTFAKELVRGTGLPYVQMDQLFWLADWTMPADEDFAKKLERTLSESPAWVWTETTIAFAISNGKISTPSFGSIIPS